MHPSCNILQTGRRLPCRALAALALLLCFTGTLSAAQGNPPPAPELTTPEWLAKFWSATPSKKIEILAKLIQPKDPKDFERYKIPDFLIKVLKDTDQDPRVREAALQGMVLAIQKLDTSYRGQFIPAFLDVLSEKQVGLVQEYVLIASPSAVDPEGPGPNKLLLNKIASIAEDAKMSGDNELRLRIQAIIALGKIGNKDYLDKFFKLMSDPNKEIIPPAIEAVNQFLRTRSADKLELTAPQVSIITNILKNKDTTVESKAAILRTLGVNAKSFRATHPANQTSPAAMEVMAEIKTLLNPPAGTELPPYFVVGACIETLGMYGQKDSIDLIKLIFKWDYLKLSEGAAYRMQAVDVVDQVIAANIGEGKSKVPVVEDIASLLLELLADEKESIDIRKAAAFYLADVRFPCYKRDLYFNELFIHAYLAPGTQGVTLDDSLATVCKKSMELIAGRTFSPDWTYSDFLSWWTKVGKAELAPR